MPGKTLLIHAGLHKTATNAFQRICRNATKMLKKCGVVYPGFNSWPQHSYAAWDLFKGNQQKFRKFIESAHAQSEGASYVLVSGEDFENCLLSANFAKIVEDEAYRAGFDEVVWCFVIRNQFDYYLSLYAELSGHGAVLDFEKAAEIILDYGYLNTASDNFCYSFIFDYKRFLPAFESQITGKVRVFTFENFVAGYPGRVMVKDIISEELDGFFMSVLHPGYETSGCNAFHAARSHGVI